MDIAIRVQAECEQHDQRGERGKRQQEFPHQAIPGFGSGCGPAGAATAAAGTLTR